MLDIVGRDEQRLTQRIATLRQHDEYFTYVVRDAQGRVLLRSHDADKFIFPPYQGMGFRDTATHRLYYDAALQETVTIAVAEPLEHRATVAREMQGALALPLLIMIPLSLAAIFARGSLELPVRARVEERSRRAQRAGPFGGAGGWPAERNRANRGSGKPAAPSSEGGVRSRTQLCGQCRA